MHNYGIIGIVETHLDSTVDDDDRLALDGYTFINSNHPQNVKRGGAGLYVKDSLPSTNRSDLVTLPECAICEIQLNRKRYFLSLSIEVQVRTRVISIISHLTFIFCYPKCRLKILFA